MVKEQRLELRCPKTPQSGDDLTYAKKEIQALTRLTECPSLLNTLEDAENESK